MAAQDHTAHKRQRTGTSSEHALDTTAPRTPSATIDASAAAAAAANTANQPLLTWGVPCNDRSIDRCCFQLHWSVGSVSGTINLAGMVGFCNRIGKTWQAAGLQGECKAPIAV